MMNNIAVGLGEIKISRDPDDVLVAFGLGSCVGIGVYDPVAHVAGMLHAVLPKQNDANAPLTGKFVDTGIPLLLDEVVKAGGVRSRFKIKMAGGANIMGSPNVSTIFDIGNRNVESARAVFKNLGIRIEREEVGGHIGRTVRLYTSDGRMTFRVMGGKEVDL
jgi:chemotaxis protein CheD